jgi:hypothetical protein
MENIKKILLENEDWLVQSILDYAKNMNYTPYTSTLFEAWRISISGISEMIIKDLEVYDDFNIYAEQSLDSNMAEFGKLEARKHRERGVPLKMFLSLTKYYRDTYMDFYFEKLVNNSQLDLKDLMHLFDVFEIAYVDEWQSHTGEHLLNELQDTNRRMTNEKNLYLTIFESTTEPMILLDVNKKLMNLNMAAASLLSLSIKSGTVYYLKDSTRLEDEGNTYKESIEEFSFEKMFQVDLDYFIESSSLKEMKGHAILENSSKIIRYKMSKMMDVSSKFTGIVITLL